MPIIENFDLPRIRADLAKCEQRIAQMEGGTAGVIPAEFAHVDAGQAHRNQLAARYTDLRRLQGEFIRAMTATGAWHEGEIITLMTAAKSPNVRGTDLAQRSIIGHLAAARRHLDGCDDPKTLEHLTAASQLIHSRNNSGAAQPERYKESTT